MKTKNFLLVLILFAAFTEVFGQVGAFQVRRNSATDHAIQIGYNDYRYLSFGISTGTPNNGAWAIEHWKEESGLNFWKPWPTANMSNFRMFLPDNYNACGINMKPFSLSSSSFPIGNFTLHVKGFTVSHANFIWSDQSLKTNIADLENTMQKILQLTPKKYFYVENQPATSITDTTDEAKINTINGTTNQSNPTSTDLHYGLLAQELETVFPNLVSQVGDVKAVNYTELIPVLIKGMQQQQLVIEDLKDKVTELENKTAYEDVDQTRLFQNSPNPYTANTTFSYFIDENTQFTTAVIEIRNLSGFTQSSISLEDKSGLGQVTYDGSSLIHGYYVYSLLIDGTLKDSKMMLIADE